MLSKISNHKLKVFIILALLMTVSGCRELSESLESGEDKNLKAVQREKPNLSNETAKVTVDPDSDKLTEEKNAPVEKPKSNTETNSNTSTKIEQTPKKDEISETTSDGICAKEPADNEIFVYSDANFKGTCVKLGKIGYKLPNMDGFDIPNDSISSIKVGSKVQAEVCEDNDYQGVCESLLQDVSNLEDSDVGNDSISSIKILGKD